MPGVTGTPLPPMRLRRLVLIENGWEGSAGQGGSWKHERFGHGRVFTTAAAYRAQTGLYDAE